MSSAIYSGYFSPFTIGHSMVFENAIDIFDKVYLVIADNPAKSRCITAQTVYDGLMDYYGNIYPEEKFEVVIYNKGLIADLARTLGVKYLVRGIRNTSDYLYEVNIAETNKMINNDLTTIYIQANSNISSSMVLELYKNDYDVSAMLPFNQF